jgi:hypothetical protein
MRADEGAKKSVLRNMELGTRDTCCEMTETRLSNPGGTSETRDSSTEALLKQVRRKDQGEVE